MAASEAPSGSQTVTSRLDSIQRSILDCLNVTADIMESLSEPASAPEDVLVSNCKRFLENIRRSQEHLAHLVDQSQGSQDVETTVYCQMVQANIVAEKSNLIDKLLEQAVVSLEASHLEDVILDTAAMPQGQSGDQLPAAAGEDQAQAMDIPE